MVSDRSMNSEKVLKTVEQLLQKSLSQIEQRVLILSWEGQSYRDIEENTGYVIGYLRDIGSSLWKELSEVLNQRVTKKNLSLILEQWEQNQDLVQPSKKALFDHTNFEQDSPVTRNNTSFPSAPIPFNSPLYIKRPPLEELARNEIERQACLLRIKAPQKMGKSSLLNQVIAHAHSLGYQTVYIDFKDTEETIFSQINLLLRWFCAAVCQQLNLPPNLNYYWDEDVGSKMSCKIFFENYILEHTKLPLIIIINEVNCVFEYPQTAADFLPLLRSFHEQSRRSATWQKLRMVLVYSTDIYVPVSINQSPFNVGLSLILPPFNRVQVLDLAQRYGLNWQLDQQIEQFIKLVGGHPYLVNIALYFLSQRVIILEQLLLEAHTPNGIYAQHLQSYLNLLHHDSKLVSLMHQIVDSSCPLRLDPIAAYKLQSMGLVTLENFYAKPSCELYRLYFREVLQD